MQSGGKNKLQLSSVLFSSRSSTGWGTDDKDCRYKKSSHCPDALNKSLLSYHGSRVPGVGKRGRVWSRSGKRLSQSGQNASAKGPWYKVLCDAPGVGVQICTWPWLSGGRGYWVLNCSSLQKAMHSLCTKSGVRRVVFLLEICQAKPYLCQRSGLKIYT